MRRLAWFLFVLAIVVDPLYYVVPKDLRQDFIWHASALAIAYSAFVAIRQEQIAPDE